MLLKFVPESARTLAFTGLAKNVGKTTALVDLLDDLEDDGLVAGLLSVGIDGEQTDRVSGAPKPRIDVGAGVLVATTDSALKHGTAAADVLVATGIRSPLGEVMLARVRRPGRVLLAGVRHAADVRRLRDLLCAHGAARVLVDGAFDRLAACAPETSDATVLAVGMAAASTVDELVRRAAQATRTLRLPVAPAGLRPPSALAEQVAVFRYGAWQGAGRASLLAGAAFDAADAEAVFVPGLVSDTVLAGLSASLPPGAALVARDATRVLAAPAAFRRFASRRPVYVLEPVHLAVVTVNPTRRDGSLVPVRPLIDALAAALSDLPIADVRSGALVWPDERR